MMFPLYTLAYAGAALCAGPFYLVRGLRTGKYLWSLADRLGRVRFDPAAKSGPRVWIHALSLGEVVSASHLARRLGAEGYQVCLSTTTRSGYEAARERLSSTVPRLCFPLDWPPAVSRALNAVNPDLFVLVETDIWPNFLAGLAARGIPALLVNGRVSPRSLAGYKMIKPLWTRVLGLFDLIACQSALDRERMLSLGAGPEKVVVTGSLKHDRPIPKTGPLVRAGLLAETGLPDGLWLVGGSTHPGEDEALLKIFQSLRAGRPQLRLLLAPRNRSRFQDVWRLINGLGLPAGRRSGPKPGPDIHVFLLDTQGELDRFYELADIVFMGKSLPKAGEGGGHNLLEPGARAKPVLFGPRMHNFPAMADLMISSGGARQVAGPAELKTAVAELLDDPAERAFMGACARGVVEANTGALDRTMGLIHQTLAPERTAL